VAHFVLWLVRRNAMLAFWIGMSAQASISIVVSGLMVLLGVKRSTNLEIPLPGGGRFRSASMMKASRSS
jgi:hypothetical protein